MNGPLAKLHVMSEHVMALLWTFVWEECLTIPENVCWRLHCTFLNFKSRQIGMFLPTQLFSISPGQEKNFAIHLPSGPVNFSFLLSPLKYYLPNGNTTCLINCSSSCPRYCLYSVIDCNKMSKGVSF